MLRYLGMKRPSFTQCIVIDNGQYIWIKASMAAQSMQSSLEDRLPTSAKAATPFDKISLLKKNQYKLKIEGRSAEHKKIYEKEVETDRFGNLQMKIPAYSNGSNIERIQFFETSLLDGFELLVDNAIPYKMKFPLKIIITDFDKTLVETKYSTPKEMYLSLSKPLNYFPTIEASLEMLKKYIADDFQPFVLSASPHFYEKPIRDWLYRQKIYTSNIFLKDYRDALSWTLGELSPKDIKTQGFYKLDALVDILESSTLPDELVLMGDGFESDSLVYLALRSILIEKRDPWQVWNHLKSHHAFKLTTRQSFIFLQRLSKLSHQAKQKENMKLEIHIRCRENSFEEIKNRPLDPTFFEDQKKKINFYIA